MFYDNSHALIYVSWHQQLPDSAKIYINVDNVLRRVKKIVETSRGLRAVTVMPEGIRRLGVNEDDLLVVSYLALEGSEAESFIRSARLACLPSQQRSYVCCDPTVSCYH
jgi:hypothetical protein